MLIFTMKKRSLILLVLLVIAIVVTFAIVGSVIALASGQGESSFAIRNADVETQTVALTFNTTSLGEMVEIMQILDRFDVPATFFITGIFKENYPEAVAQLIQAGHEIGTMGENNLRMDLLDREQFMREVQGKVENIQYASGQETVLVRPPFGEYNQETLANADYLDLMMVMYSLDSRCRSATTGHQITQRVVNHAQAGDIIRFDTTSGQALLDSLPMMLIHLQGNGFDFQTAGAMLNPVVDVVVD